MQQDEQGNQFIDPELWLHALLAMTADEKDREALMRKVSKNTGLNLEKVEIIHQALMEYLINHTRGN